MDAGESAFETMNSETPKTPRMDRKERETRVEEWVGAELCPGLQLSRRLSDWQVCMHAPPA
jgi:hypothetical protein